MQALLLGPPLLASIRAQAPRASLSFLAIQANVRERIETGDIDLAFAMATTPLPPGAYSEPLAEDRLALVVRRGARPLDKPWTLAEYAAATHATVSIFGDRLSEIDAELAEAGLVRRIVFTSPHFLATLAAVGASDCVTTLSAALARRFADSSGSLSTNRRCGRSACRSTTVVAATRAEDPGIIWLRGRLKEAAREVFRD